MLWTNAISQDWFKTSFGGGDILYCNSPLCVRGPLTIIYDYILANNTAWRACHHASFEVISSFYRYQGSLCLYVHPANERRRYTVTSSLIGRAHTHNDPCVTDRNVPYILQQNGFNHDMAAQWLIDNQRSLHHRAITHGITALWQIQEKQATGLDA